MFSYRVINELLKIYLYIIADFFSYLCEIDHAFLNVIKSNPKFNQKLSNDYFNSVKH